MTAKTTQGNGDIPRGNVLGLTEYLRNDLLSGFLVFLIALPLCLGISLACGYPPVAGIFTAIIGSILTTFISNSELTIKGPAAGLIVIAIGTITQMGEIFGTERAYQMALGIGVAAGLIQVLFGLFRIGILGEIFPSSAVHGMLAAIGIIIISKEVHKVLGVTAHAREPLELIGEIPNSIMHLNPEIAFIGILSLIILFGLPFIKNRFIRMIPAPMIVVLIAIPLGMYFDLDHEHTYTFLGYEEHVGPEYLVALKPKLLGLFDEITFPDFEGLTTFTGWKWVIMFALIGSLESLLSAKAVDMIDPYRRKTNLDRDLLAVGLGNTACAMVGGLPMISEIVRSKANIDNGAKTRFADMYHGLFLLSFVAFLPGLIHQIPLTALSAMLVYTGFRLASPKEFQNVFRIGREQLVIFVSTIIGVLATDLLIGIGIGIAVKCAIHVLNGVPFRVFFKPFLVVEQRDENTSVIIARESAVFSNWIPFRKQIEQLGLVQRNKVIVDLSDTRLVDHSVMEKMHELQADFEQEGLTLEIIGLEGHQQSSGHSLAARKRGLASIRRISIIAEPAAEESLLNQLSKLGATGYTKVECTGAGRQQMFENPFTGKIRVKIEVLVPLEKAEPILDWIRREIAGKFAVTACVETVQVVSSTDFSPLSYKTPDAEAPLVQQH